MKEKSDKIFSYLNLTPKIDASVFLASGSKIVGDVAIGEGSSIWFNTVVRGDVNYITIGKMTNVQDLSMLHVTKNTHPLVIGNNVTIGHSVTLHGCTLKDNCFIGMGATILDGAVIEPSAMVAAGALVKQNFIVPTGKLVAGVPAKIIRNLSEEEINLIIASIDLSKSEGQRNKAIIETLYGCGYHLSLLRL